MADVTLRSLSEYSLVDTCRDALAVFAAAGDEVPTVVDAAWFDFRYRSDHLDRLSSLLAVIDGRPGGVVLVARRGHTSHVSALAVARPFQRQGVASALMSRVLAEARSREDRRVVVEVVAGDPVATALYARFGFGRVRGLGGHVLRGSLTAPPDRPIARVDPTEVASAVARHGATDLPWFYHPATLYGCTPPAIGYALDGRAHCIVVPRSTHVTMRALVVEPQSRRQGLATALLSAVAHRYSASAIIVPPLAPDGLGAGFLQALGFAPTPIRHDELELRLAPSTPHEGRSEDTDIRSGAAASGPA
ncbi:MAG: GNAT family N-acetyltransferase [Vicinamibacterales bacterium]